MCGTGSGEEHGLCSSPFLLPKREWGILPVLCERAEAWVRISPVHLWRSRTYKVHKVFTKVACVIVSMVFVKKRLCIFKTLKFKWATTSQMPVEYQRLTGSLSWWEAQELPPLLFLRRLEKGNDKLCLIIVHIEILMAVGNYKMCSFSGTKNCCQGK